MYSLTQYLTKLKELPSEIFSTEDYKITYRGTIVLTGHNPLYYYPTSAGKEMLTTKYPEILFSRDRKTVQFIIETIFLQECTPPSLFFRNGGIRAAALRAIAAATTSSSSQENKTPVLQYIQTKLIQNWSKLTETTKQKLSPYCDTNGNIMRRLTINLLQNGFFLSAKVDPNQYVKSMDLILSCVGTCYIPKDSPKLYTIFFREEHLNFTQEEWDWFILKFKKCSSCNQWENKENFIFGLCSNCSPNSPTSLETYSTRATDKFDSAYTKSRLASPHLLGVELEYEQKPNADLKETLFLLHKSLKDHAIFKRDGSLSNGVEICTRPASLDIHLEELLKFYNDPLIWERLEVKPSCGMHVHIDRRKMSALSLGKLITFVQQKSNQPFIEKIAGRNSCAYSLLGNDLPITSFHRGTASHNRYLGMNTQNKNTAELRIFKTPSTFSEFRKNMEFTSALTSFVQPSNSGIKDTTYGAFLNYVSSNKSTYKELAKFHKNNF